MLSELPLEGFEAWVETRSKRQRLNEHKIDHYTPWDYYRNPSRAECFLETIDEPYIIGVKKDAEILDHKGDWRCEVFVDGRKLGCNMWKPNKSTLWYYTAIIKEGDKFLEGDLTFSPLPLTDDSAQVTFQPESIPTLGTIDIRLTPGTWKEVVTKPKPHTYVSPFNVSDKKPSCYSVDFDQGVAHEKEKKYAYTTKITNCKEYIPALPNNTCTKHEFTPLDYDKPSYKFLFKYRARPVLELNEIVAPLPPAIQPVNTSTVSPASSTNTATTSSLKRAYPTPSLNYGSSYYSQSSYGDSDAEREVKRLKSAMKQIQDENQSLRQDNKKLREGQRIEDSVVFDLTQCDSDSD